MIQGRRIDSVALSESGGVTAFRRPCHSLEHSADILPQFVSLSQHRFRDGGVGGGAGVK